MKRYKVILLIFGIIILIFGLVFFISWNSNYNKSAHLISLSNLEINTGFELYRLNYCQVDSDCAVGCSSILQPCGQLYLYNKNEDLSYLNKLSKKQVRSEILCDMDYCHEFENGHFKDVKINCINNMCVPDNNHSSLFMSYETIPV